MSLLIDVDAVVAVWIAGIRHEVGFYENDVSSFEMDSYEYASRVEFDHDGGGIRLGGGQEQAAGVPATGFMFSILGTKRWMAGPITAIQAVEYDPSITKQIKQADART